MYKFNDHFILFNYLLRTILYKLTTFVDEMKKLFLLLFIAFQVLSLSAQEKKTVLVFDIKENIAPAVTRLTSKAIAEAERINADLIIIHMNTYGGYVVDADSIRTKILNTEIPVYTFIDNNAASAGALISIASDKIYMRPGGSIGAATVVNQSGEAAPDKYQSYMRKQMRSTAESHGKDTIINGRDTTFRWKRDPNIAEGMVDQRVIVKGIVDSTKVITFTVDEALQYGYCEGSVKTIEEILEKNGITNYEIVKVEKSTTDKIIGFFANPAVSSILILIILGGLYFELQSPGVGFPLAAAILAAILYFVPLYIEGLAEHWEILMFIVGVILLGVEIFVLPGFGIAGGLGIVFILSGLILSLLMNVTFDFTLTGSGAFSQALTVVFSAFVGFILFMAIFGRGFLNSKFFQRIVLQDVLPSGASETSSSSKFDIQTLVGQELICQSDLKPMGTVKYDYYTFNAKTYDGFIESGEKVKVLSIENRTLIVSRV